MTLLRSAMLLLVSLMSVSASTIFNPTCVTNNSTICDTYAFQLNMTATNNGNNVQFTLINEAGGFPSSIAAVYFETSLGAIQTFNGVGTNFSVGGSPSSPPAGSTIGFITNQYVTANPPPPTSGVNPGEIFNIYLNTENVANVGDAIDLTRVAIHLIGLPNGASETIVFTPGGNFGNPGGGGGSEVPEPTGYALMGGGLIALGLMGRCYRNQ